MSNILLTKGKYAIVDDEDYEWLSKIKWLCTSDGRAAHHYRDGRKVVRVYMSRLITKCPADMVVDHINRNRLDNRRGNLRICTRTENNRNRRFSKNKSSRFIGVHLRKRDCAMSKSWCSYIWHGKHQLIGYFATEEEAARARDQRAIELFGEFAQLNFPFTRGSRPDLKYEPTNLVCSCQECNTSGNKNRSKSFQALE